VKEIPPQVFRHYFPNGWTFLVQILLAYYTFLSTPDIFIQLPATLTKLCHNKRDHSVHHMLKSVHHRPKRTLGGPT